MITTHKLEGGKIGLIQQTKDGRIIQIAITEEQSEALQSFLAEISQKNPLVQMGEEYDLVLKSSTKSIKEKAIKAGFKIQY